MNRNSLLTPFLTGLLFLFAASVNPEAALAQTANQYTAVFATSASLISQTSPTTLLSAPNDDNVMTSAQAIGFNFSYEGVTYTHFVATPDGIMKLLTSSSGTGSSAFSNSITSTTNLPKLMPFWDDLALGSSTGGGYVQYSLEGSSPNYKAVIEWYVTIPRNTSGNPTTKFQVVLNQAGNTIEYIYGGTPGTGSLSASAGLGGVIATNYLSVTFSSNSVSSTTANNTITAYPTIGTKITFTPPPACSGTPTSTLTASVTSACTATPFTLTRVGAPGTGLTYQVQSSPQGANTWTTIGTTMPHTVASQSASTDYRIIVTCTNSSLTHTSAPLTVTQNPPMNCYCTPAYSSTGCTFDDDINTFTLVGDQGTAFNDLNTGCSPTAYDNRSAFPAVTLTRGVTYSGTMSSTYGSTESAKIWIDFNDNGVFESADSVGIMANVPSTATGFTITIPSTTYAAVGKHRMRVRLVYNATVGTIDPCSLYTYGETHDYSVNIVCPAASNPTASLGADTFLCPGATMTLNAGNPGSSYVFNNSATTQSITINATGTYSVAVTNSIGCITRDTVVVKAGSFPVVNLGTDALLCPGTTATLNAANAGSRYLFSNAATTQTTVISAPGSYSVSVTNPQGCSSSDTIVFTGGIQPQVNLGIDTAICPSTFITLNAGNPGASYLFSNAATSQTTNVTAGGIFSVRVTNAQGCIGRDTIVITQGSNPVVNLGNDTALCPGFTLPIVLNAGNPGSTFLYSTNATTQTLSVSTAGTYSVRVTNANKCVGRDTIVVVNGVNPSVSLGNDTTICPGTTIALNAGNPGASYLYSNAATTRIASITTGGSYSVRVTNSFGCIARDTINIAQGVNPVVALGRDTAFCPGASILLNAGNPGSSYLYSNGATTQTLTVSTAGTYNVRVTNPQKCIGRDTIVIAAASNPVVNLGADTSFCPGSSVLLNAGNAGSSFLYSTGATTQTLAVTTAGTYNVRVTSPQKCVGRDTIVIIAASNPIVNLGNDTAVCAGVAFTLDAGNTGSQFLYSTGATTQTLSVIPSGSYSVRVTNPQKCVGRDTINISILPLPLVNLITTARNSNTIAFSSDAVNTTGYDWSFGDNSTATGASPTHSYATNGTYTVRLIASNECGRDTVTSTVTITGLSAGSIGIGESELVIAPNPASTTFTITNGSALKMQSLTLLNSLGAIVLRQEGIDAKRALVDAGALPAGTYLLRIQTDGGLVLRRVQLQK